VAERAALPPDPDRNLALDLVRATEAAAMAAARHLGRGDKELVDQAAVDAMRPIGAARQGTGVDVLIGIGGAPEGVIAACALKCLDGALFGRLWPRDKRERRAALDAGYDLERVLTIDDLARGGNIFFAATGVTDGELLRGVRFEHHEVLTQSLSMRSKSGAVRLIDARHQLGRSNLVARAR
jgi:fructose-1,6-bisphosphatase/sedoheptulose 1,7-bisphosphatase-like protein